MAGPPADLSITPGRLYVDGIQVECFPEDGATYQNQPFHPPLTLPASGDAVAYLDVWEREVTYIEDGELLDPALGGADTTTRRQTVWQLRVDSVQGAACGMTNQNHALAIVTLTSKERNWARCSALIPSSVMTSEIAEISQKVEKDGAVNFVESTRRIMRLAAWIIARLSEATSSEASVKSRPVTA